MPFNQNINTIPALDSTDKQAILREFTSLRQELDEIRSAYTATRALLVAGTAVGAGYNVATNQVPPTVGFAALAASVPPRFTAS